MPTGGGRVKPLPPASGFARGRGGLLRTWLADSAYQWLAVLEHELLLFAAVWFAIGAADELVMDGIWLWQRLTGAGRTGQLAGNGRDKLSSMAAVFVPAWRESAVIGPMVAHCLAVWPQEDLRIYVGCYRNDQETLNALTIVSEDPRVRVVVHDRDGPTTKADCLNRLYLAMRQDERRSGQRIGFIVLHDAEDMVHPAALALMDRALDTVDFVQLPVRPEPQASSPWVAGHYCDEFAEAHARDMVVRDHIGAGLPSAGVGCAFSRAAIERIVAVRGGALPFAADCLTEDYEAGMLVAETGGRSRFIRVRDARGELVATREFFPDGLAASVRQKTRWVHGIAFQGWDRLGWNRSAGDLWMRLRDRRGPLVALVLLAAYLALPLWPIVRFGEMAGFVVPVPPGPVLKGLLAFNLCSLIWRLVVRALFTGSEYGWIEGVRSVFRFPVGNIIAIMAARRAAVAYVRVLFGGALTWDHTLHCAHPVQAGVGLASHASSTQRPRRPASSGLVPAALVGN